MGLKGLNLAGSKPRAAPNNSAQMARVIKETVQETDRHIAETNSILDKSPPELPTKHTTCAIDCDPVTPCARWEGCPNAEGYEENIDDSDEKLSRLVDDDFPFDDTQLTAIYGLAQEQYGCMIGAAGTGKTTTTKKLVDILRTGLDEIDMSQYWKRDSADQHDDYEAPERFVPSIAMVSFTGRATQMIKKNFPRDWHGNIMTIHRALGFYPEYYQDYDEATGELVGKRRFVPSYTADNLMPWDIIIIDEAGMLGLELWHQLWAATKSTCRIIMIGDINQLPPTHGKSVLGFALASWPTWELTHVHRQQGANNSIVDNAHRILKGLRPVSDSPTPLSVKTKEGMLETLNFMTANKDWRFLTVDVPEDHRAASLRIRQVLQLLQGKIYEPNRDVVITPINGFEQTAPGYSLGQSPLNQDLVVKLNSGSPRYFIDAGREKQNFAVGDKVMATVNDYESGITNGMTGIIKSIEPNGAYTEDSRRWGLIEEVQEYLNGLDEEEDDSDVVFSLEEMVSDSQAGLEELKKRDKRDTGPASHIVEVEFGEGDHGFSINFDSKAKVASLMLAYAATCHKMQGGECPLVFCIVHQGNRGPLKREWYYTGVTRASERCVVFTTRQGSGFALGKQDIKGTTLEQKVKTFQALTKSGLVGPSVRVKLPKRQSLSTEVTHYEPKEITNEPQTKQESRHDKAAEGAPTATIRVNKIEIHVHQAAETGSSSSESREDIDGGTLRAEPRKIIREALPAPRFVSTMGAVKMQRRLEDESAKLLLTHQPSQKPTPTPTRSTKPLSIGALLKKQRNPK